MSENVDETTLQQLTLLSADSLANLTVLPGSDEAQRMTAISGLSLAALLPNSNPATSLLRTFLESSPPISTRCYLTWTTSDTPARRLIFRLLPSMPLIADIESSLWLSPTEQGTQNERYDIGNFRTLAGQVKMWRTPHASDGDGGVMEMRKGTAGHYKLRDHVQERNKDFWPTPTSRDYKDGNGTEWSLENSKQHLGREVHHTEGL